MAVVPGSVNATCYEVHGKTTVDCAVGEQFTLLTPPTFGVNHFWNFGGSSAEYSGSVLKLIEHQENDFRYTYVFQALKPGSTTIKIKPLVYEFNILNMKDLEIYEVRVNVGKKG